MGKEEKRRKREKTCSGERSMLAEVMKLILSLVCLNVLFLMSAFLSECVSIYT